MLDFSINVYQSIYTINIEELQYIDLGKKYESKFNLFLFPVEVTTNGDVIFKFSKLFF